MDIFVHENSTFGVNFWEHILDEFKWTLFSGDHKWCQHCWSANIGDAVAKPLLGSANTVQCQVRVCRDKVPARISKPVMVMLGFG